MAIKYDRSSTGIVIYCTECPHWTAFRWGDADADACSNDHEARVHPGEYNRRNANARRVIDRRHAEERKLRS